MNVDEAKFQLEMAERNLRGCYAHLERALAAWRDGEAARGDNTRHYRLRRTIGDNYRQFLTDQKYSALKECRDAENWVARAKEALETAIINSGGNIVD